MTTTATAATQAGVTIDTIRTWCRYGAVAAIKQAGRWVINAASLTRRITIGTRRNTVTNPTNPATSTMAQRGPDYVAAWPDNIARQVGLSPSHIAEALVRTGLADRDEQTALGAALLRSEPVDQIGALTPELAMKVIAELRAIAREINDASKTHCHYCGLKLLANGECRSCGNLEN